jgi:hypothetical protein
MELRNVWTSTEGMCQRGIGLVFSARSVEEVIRDRKTFC